MSRENVEVARRAFELFNARDLPAFFALFHPELTYRNREDEPVVRTYRGVDELRRYIAGWLETFDELRLVTQDFIDHDDHVVVVTELRGRGGMTGAEVRGSYVFLFRFRDGAIVQGSEYATPDEALAAATPAEPGPAP